MADLKRKRADSARSPSRRQPPERLPCPSWVMSTRSDVQHEFPFIAIAKDRSWFGDDYKTISSFIHGPLKDERAQVIGVGTVILPVKVSPDATNRDRSEVKLYNGLHAPDSICNIIGTPIFEKYHISLQPGIDNAGTITLKDSTAVGYFRLPALNIYELRLAGPPIGPRVGPSPFEPDSRILVIAKWPRWERGKWERRLDEIRNASSARDNAGSVEIWDRVSSDEKHWLRKTYGNEFKFMGAMRLNIKDERDRDEGLRLMRSLIKKEGSTASREPPRSTRQPEPASNDKGLRIIGNAAADAGLYAAKKPEQATGSQQSSSSDKGFNIARIPDAEPNRAARAPTGSCHTEPSPNDKGKQSTPNNKANNPPNNKANNQPNKAAPKPAKNKGQQEPAAHGKGSQPAPNSKAQTAKNGAGNPAKNNQQHKPAASDTNRQVGRPVMADTAANAVPLGPPRTPQQPASAIDAAAEAEKKRLEETKRIWLQSRRTNSETSVTKTATATVETATQSVQPVAMQNTPRTNDPVPATTDIKPSDAVVVRETPRTNGLVLSTRDTYSSDAAATQETPRTNALALTALAVSAHEAAPVRDTPRTNGLALTRYRFVEDDENELTAYAKFRVRHLSTDEFAWMNDHHGGTQAFMSKLGLKATRHADREKAQQVISILMGE